MAFTTDDPNVLNDWLTLGPLTSLVGTSAEAPRRTRLLGQALSLWRDASGGVEVRADDRALPVLVRYGYIWVCAGTPPVRPLFAFPEFEQPGRRIVDCHGFGVATSGLRMLENFLDMGHFPFVHPHYLGEWPHTEVAPYKVHVDRETDEIWATDCSFYQPRTSGSATAGVQARYRYRVMQPMTAMLFKTAFPRPDELDAIALFVQPVEPDRIVAYVLLVYFDDVTSDTDMIAFQHLIFGQDKPILENQVPKCLPLYAGGETPTRCDLLSGHYRRWLRERGMRYGAC